MRKPESTQAHAAELQRLKRIEGQVRGLIRMVEDSRYCLDIVTQIKAVRSALRSVEARLVESHMNHCVKKALTRADRAEADRLLEEIMELLKSAGAGG